MSERLLLDSCALLWAVDDDPRLGAKARVVLDESREMAVSVAALWEIYLKVSLSKLEAPARLLETIRSRGLTRLSISDEHLEKLGRLPWHHRDPFDRLMIAQAATEGYAIVTADREFAAYGVHIVDARR